MATVTGLTAARMLAIEAASVVSGTISGDNLVLTTQGGTQIVAGNVRGATGPTGATGQVSTAAMNAAILAAMPTGVILDYISTTAPSGWLAMTGQTIANGSTTYPDLWAKLPASMKSGTSIVFPDTQGRVTIGYKSTDADYASIGQVGGEKTHILTQAELPASTITIDPPSTNISVDPPATTATVVQTAFYASIDPPATTVSVNPPATTTGGQSATHDHYYWHPGSNIYVRNDVANVLVPAAASNYLTGNANSDHTHTVDIPAFNISVDIPAFNATIAPPNVDVTIDIPAFTTAVDIPAFSSGNLGSGTAHNNVSPYVVFLKIIKVL